MWMRAQCQDWWDRILASNFTDNDRRKNFRVTRHNFCHLVAAMATPFMTSSDNYIRSPVALDKRVATALYKLAICREYHIVANQFGVHISTVRFFYVFPLGDNAFGMRLCKAAINRKSEQENVICLTYLERLTVAYPITALKKAYRDCSKCSGSLLPQVFSML